jgi:1,4-alpha-glucan branching enzyme
MHTHLPWVLHHGTWPHGVDWMSEAVAECYIPLLNVFNDLLNEGIKAKVTLDISPVLCEQLEHDDFKEIFRAYCLDKIKWAQQDEKQFIGQGTSVYQVELARFWQKWYYQRLSDFNEKYKSSIVSVLRELQDAGAIEIMTCGATHGYLPLLGTENSINLQIKTAVENYRKHFGREPRGIWLPECAYRPSYDWKSYIPIAPYHHPRLRPGIEQALAKYGIEYFVTDQDLTDRAKPLGVYLDQKKDKFVAIDSPAYEDAEHRWENMVLKPFHVSSSEKTEYGTAIAFTRHKEISMQVWSGDVGYPGEPDYLDFHKKHYGSMLRYWRVTDSKADMMYKTLYQPDKIWDRIDKQTNHFIHHIENTINWLNREQGTFTTLCTPFDTELFGHWWFEGPEFLRSLLRGLSKSPYANTATASEQILMTKPNQVMLLPEGSWGENNNHDVWSDKQNKWTWVAIYNNENRLREMYQKYPPSTLSPLMRRIMTQALREMMLLHSSDWQFLIHNKSAQDYAEQRFSYHHSDFNRLCDIAEKASGNDHIDERDEYYLKEAELRNSVFPELQLEWWSE